MARGDAPPVLHAPEDALDEVAPAIGAAVQRMGFATGTGGGNDHLGALRLQELAEVIGIIGFVGEQATWRRDAVEQVGGDADVGDVAGRQDEGERSAFSIGHSVDLAGPPAA